MPTGRNDPCPCGSGLKYKRCCLEKQSSQQVPSYMSQDIPPDMQPLENAVRSMRGPARIGQESVQTVWNGKRWRAVGSQAYYRPPQETFYEFTVHLLLKTLGSEWREAQRLASTMEKHPIWLWIESEQALRKSSKPISTTPDGRFEFQTNGAVQCLATIAYDTYSLLCKNSLPMSLIKRLRHPQEFQGARYEVSVAALFARAGCTIDWQDDVSIKHCEFIAVHPSQEKIGVEAKSRRRPGVLGHPGVLDHASATKGDIGRLLRDALTQAPREMPFAVFIDVNCPASPDVPIFEKTWWDDLRKLLDSYGTPSPESPDPFNALCVTSFSYHYHSELVGHAGGDYIAMISRYAKYPMKRPDLLAQVVGALQSYGSIPTDG